MFFIHDDEAQVRRRGEDGGTGSDGYPHVAARQAAPFVEPFTPGKPAVEHRECGGEARGEALHELRGQGDFRNQDDGRPALLKDRGDRPHVDFGLAAARHSVQQDRGAVRVGEAGLDAFERARLGVVQHGRRRGLRRRCGNHPPQVLGVQHLHHPCLLQPLDRGRGAGNPAAQGFQLAAGLRQQAGQNVGLPGGAAAELLLKRPCGIGAGDQAHHRRGPFAHPRRQPSAALNDETLIPQAPQHPREVGAAGGAGESPLAQGSLPFQAAQHLPCPAGRPRLRSLPRRGRQIVYGFRATAEPFRHCGLDHLAPRTQVIIGDPPGQPQQVRRHQGRVVQDFA